MGSLCATNGIQGQPSCCNLSPPPPAPSTPTQRPGGPPNTDYCNIYFSFLRSLSIMKSRVHIYFTAEIYTFPYNTFAAATQWANWTNQIFFPFIFLDVFPAISKPSIQEMRAELNVFLSELGRASVAVLNQDMCVLVPEHSLCPETQLKACCAVRVCTTHGISDGRGSACAENGISGLAACCTYP